MQLSDIDMTLWQI